ncbi:FlgO family outer membrane protein [Brumicola nitratireducens]|uniref:FlgO domain-containing protein n=1 Tax=Glaciecola nitratireducens (strain JCM 12485 / KCTC 12276 / FR1064) TaxID=1085623 RepID=G4QKQ1_GLANF|nr:FlgO family outer membrane protein [Glaciecola nitratireducens]AEP30354.1 hypothetical protein GNIT_2253 [Glaciecola nitratireducens FR1064]
MKRTLLGLLISATLCGCSMFSEDPSLNTDTNSDDNSQVVESDTSAPLQSSLMFQQQFKQKLRYQANSAQVNKRYFSSDTEQNGPKPLSTAKHNINHYAQGLMQDLVANLQYVNATTPVAVVSFVMLDSDYNQANLLGVQLAESLIHEVHKFGIPVIDFKATGFIRITEQGDFAFSKDYQDFSGDLPARYVIGGTMSKLQHGYLVNARIVGFNSKAVVASAQSFIPNEIAYSLVKSSQPNPPVDNSPSDRNIKTDPVSQNNDQMLNKTQSNTGMISLIGS